tara:strand:- start:705 stop:932 length:228 start_codon:yes stop_codon:yes gene_type:complete
VNFVENFIHQNYTKKRLNDIATDHVKIKPVLKLKRSKTNISIDVVDTQGQQLSGFGVLLKTVIRNQKSNAITVEF